MFRLSFEVDGVQQISRGIERFSRDVRDYTPAFENMSRDFRQIERMQFETQGGRSGAWAPLSPRYARTKAKLYPGQPILVATGRLRASLMGKTEDTIEEIEPMSLTLGTSDPKAIFHHRGTRNMPRRPVIALTEADKKRWVKYVQRHLVDSAREARLT